MSGLKWWSLNAYNSEILYGIGTEAAANEWAKQINEADILCGIGDREINKYRAHEIHDPERIAMLEASDLGVFIPDELKEPMITATDLPVAFDYGSAATVAALRQLPLESLADLQAAARVLAGDLGIDCEVAVTCEDFDDFDKSRRENWNESGTAIRGDLPLPCLAWSGVQTAKGERRIDIAVVDCGDLRAVLTA